MELKLAAGNGSAEVLIMRQWESAWPGYIPSVNSLLAQHMTTEQIATLMGVSARHTKATTGGLQEERSGRTRPRQHRGRRPANVTPDSVIA